MKPTSSTNKKAAAQQSTRRKASDVIMADKKAEANATDNPFDPESLRLVGGAETLGVKKVLTTIPCDRPNKHVFARVHPAEKYRLETAIFCDSANRENYLVSPSVRDIVALDISPVVLFTTVDRHGNLSLWPCKLPGPDGRSNAWHESALAAAELAKQKWVRVTANMTAGRYDVFEATGNLPEPEWPDLSLTDLLKLCFENRFIDDIDHPILQSLRGEV